MATNLKVLENYVDPDVSYETTPANYIELDLDNDYNIWTEGDGVVKDLMTHEPTPAELNAAATKIDPDNPKTVNLCLLMDDSHDVGGAYYTHKVLGMGQNKRYVFAFSFDGPTASEPQLEAWDNSSHNSVNVHALGNGTPANSMIKAVCTTDSLPGADWAGSPLAGASNVLKLNNGNGALVGADDLYCNLKIKIPTAYAAPSAETFVLTIRYTWS